MPSRTDAGSDRSGAAPIAQRGGPQPQQVDVLIVGAGLSGIGAACYVKAHCPTKSFAILEERHSLGGTWDLFRYPGIRSDSDMYTLGFSFRPWRSDRSIADGPAILQYLQETAQSMGSTARLRLATASDAHRGPPQMGSGRSRPRLGRRRRSCAAPAAFYLCAAATTTTPRATGPIGRTWTGSLGASCTPSTGRTIWTTLGDG